MALAGLLARFGISGLRLSLPYHDARMPPDLHPRRLHRERQRRPHRAGLPPGGAGTPAARSTGWSRRGTNGSAFSVRASARASPCSPRRTTGVSSRRRSTTSPSTLPTWCGRTLDGARPRRARRLDRSGAAAIAVDADQPGALCPTHARHVHAARLCALRPVVSGQVVTPARQRFPTRRARPGGVRAAVRSLQHRHRSVQLAGWYRLIEFLRRVL